MKRFFCLLLVVLLVLPCFAGCGNDGELSEKEQKILNDRRTMVEQNMRWQSSVRWTPAETFQYCIGKSNGLTIDLETNAVDVVTFEKGKIYEGIPYTAGVGSGYSFTQRMVDSTDTGVMVLDLNSDLLGGGNRQDLYNVARLGNNCADMVFWAWAMVDTEICFTDTNNMVEINGCYKVGEYDCEMNMLANTPYVVQMNGQQKMFACYAQLQKGDAVVHINSRGAGHAMMSVRVNTHRREDGSIDGEKSYITVLEQNSGCERYKQSTYIDAKTGETIIRCQDNDVEFTFNRLAELGYLPITCKALIDPSPLPEAKVVDSVENPTIDNLFDGVFSCPYRISHVTIDVTDKDGNSVQQSTLYALGGEMRNFLLNRWTHPQEKPVIDGAIDLEALAAGTYTITHTAKLSNGDDVVVRTLTYTK